MTTPTRDFVHHSFVKAVAHALRHDCRVPRPVACAGEGAPRRTRLLVAVSGGADSVALWRALCLLAPRRAWRLDLRLAHINHQQRAEAAEEAAFVASLAAHQPAAPGQSPPAALLRAIDPAALVGNREAAMRRERYRLLRELAAQTQADFLVTGHHADDQLETILMRLLRGASVRGLAGIAPTRPFAREGDWCCRLIRPMLGVTHEHACQFLRDLGQPWREDATNADRSRTRARLRHDVLPVLRDLTPAAGRREAELASHLRDVAKLLDSEISRAMGLIEGSTLPRAAARALNRAVLMGLLRRWLSEAGADPDALPRKKLATIARAIRDNRGGERNFEIAGSLRVVVTRDQVQLAKPTPRRNS